MEYHYRKSHRLANYDYGSYGYYYITICTNKRKPLLSRIVGSDALVAPKLTPLGQEVLTCWKNIAAKNENVEHDAFVFMPNHIHGIIILRNIRLIPVAEKKYGFEIAEEAGRRSIQGLIRDFKSVTTRIYKKKFYGKTSLWQESFYDEIIRSDAHYQSVWNYIDGNPSKWIEDELYIADSFWSDEGVASYKGNTES